MLSEGATIEGMRCIVSRVRMVGAGLTGAVLVASACNLFDSTGCTSVAVPAVRVTIRDAATQRPLSARASVVLADGAYRDSVLTSPSSGGTSTIASLGFGRPGTYSIKIRAEGYADWSRSNVVVSGDRCGHPQTAEFIADMLRSGTMAMPSNSADVSPLTTTSSTSFTASTLYATSYNGTSMPEAERGFRTGCMRWAHPDFPRRARQSISRRVPALVGVRPHCLLLRGGRAGLPATAYAGDTLAMEIFGSSQSWFCSQTPNPQNCWGISVTNVTRSTGSGLNAADTRLYRWFAAAVEMYDLSDCHQYPGDPLTYRSISAWSYYASGSSYTSIPILMASMTFSWGVWTNGGLSLQCSYSAAAAGDSVRLWHRP